MQQPSAFLAITNQGQVACSLEGYAQVSPLTAQAVVIPVVEDQGSSYEIDDPGENLVVLGLGETAYFGLGWTDANMVEGGTTTGCLQAEKLQVVLPGSSLVLETGGFEAFICPGGTGPARLFVTAIANAAADWGVAEPI